MIGKTISHYHILEKAGAGGMGVVYKARDTQLERTVALKFLPQELAVSDDDRDSFLREARSASALDHPNIGVIHGVERSDDDHLFIVMAFYEGQTLGQKMRGGPIPVRQALDLGIQIASGLSAAHARNIVHRDIKPSNILLTGDNIAKIVDFGLARVVATPSATVSLRVSGTVPYMSPEQTLGEPVDQSCDVWALGVVLVEMLTGRHPFARDTAAAVSVAILYQPPKAIEDVPSFLQPILYRALAKEPAHRYASAREMLAELQAARDALAASGASAAEDVTMDASASSRKISQYISRASVPSHLPGLPFQRPRWMLYLPLALVFLTLAAALILPASRERLAGFFLASGEKHIAVLPFDNIGGDPASEPLAEGLLDSLTSKLSNLDSSQESLWVVPASVVRSRKVSDPSAALRELGATMAVKGSIQRRGKSVLLTVNLIDTRRLRQIGSAALEDPAGDLATLQDEAVSRLARLMNLTVSSATLHAGGERAAPAAYESYLTALGYMQRYDKAGNLDRAVTALDEAVKTDPRFALGFATMGEAYRLKNQVDPNPRWLEQAAALCQRAIQLDDRLPSVYVTLGNMHFTQGKNDLALQEFQRTLALNPRDTSALKGLATALEKLGRAAEAEATYRKAIALRPDFWDGYNALALFYNRQGRHADAIAQLRRVIELTPDNAQAYLNLGAIYLNTGDAKQIPEAEQALKKSIELAPSYPAYANLGFLLMQQKRYAESAAVTEKALQLNSKDFRVWDNLALAYEWQNDAARATRARHEEIQLLEEIIRAQPQDAASHSALAVLYAKNGLREKSISQVQTALALAPAEPGILVDAGSAYENLGDRRRALQYIHQGLRKGFPLDGLKQAPDLRGLLADASFRANGK